MTIQQNIAPSNFKLLRVRSSMKHPYSSNSICTALALDGCNRARL